MAAVDFSQLAPVAIASKDDQALREHLETLQVPTVFKGYYANTPIVLAGLNSFEAVKQELMRHYNRAPILAYRAEREAKGRIFYRDDFKGFNYRSGRTTLDVFFKAFEANIRNDDGYTYYVGSTSVADVFPTLMDEHPGIDSDNVISNLWFGGKARVAAHYDFPLNLAGNLVGRRRFTLFPPEEIWNLYPGPVAFAPGGQEISLVDFEDIDAQKFPKFKHALDSAQTVILEPGDALFIPSMWWHHVESLSEFNVLYNHWWRNSEPAYGRPSNALLSAVMSLRSLPQEQRAAWKDIFDYYVFSDPNIAGQILPSDSKGFLEYPLSREKAIALKKELQARGG